MQLLSINVGLPKEVQYKGKKVRTGIFKQTVKGPVKVNYLNLEGDQQADLTVHGGTHKAVYVYPTEHLSYWKKCYPGKAFTLGSFGENLSTTGLIESQVSIGDRLSIGTAEFMITSPRFPCYKLALKMNEPGIIKTFTQANRNGFYLKVLKEGVIQAGQSIVMIDKDGHNFKVDQFSRLYALDRHNLGLLKKAITAPNLPQDWKEYFEGRLFKATKLSSS